MGYGKGRLGTILLLLIAVSLVIPPTCASTGRIGKPDFSMRVTSVAQGVDTPANYEYGTVQITFSDSEPIEGMTVLINATIFNTGTAEGTVDVSFYDGPKGNGAIIGVDTLTIKALRYDTAMTPWNTTTIIENHVIWVYIDLNNTVDETSKDNNNESKDVVIDLFPIVSMKRTDSVKDPIPEDAVLSFKATVSDTQSDIEAGFQYNWSFDDIFCTDGNPSDVQGHNMTTVSHHYCQPGTYKVSLVVTDDGGASVRINTSLTIVNLAPKANFTYTRASDNEHEAIKFDASSSTDTPSDIAFLRYKWDFGDGQVIGFIDTPTYTKSYDKKGTYEVTLAVNDDDGFYSQVSRSIDVRNMVPIVNAGADFSVKDDDQFPLRVDVNDTANDLPNLTYRWTLDGVQIASVANFTDSHSKSGVYDYTIVVEDDNAATGSDVVRVTVVNVIPTVSASAVVENGGTTARFTATATDTPSDLANLTYLWEFGDGLKGSGEVTTHDYGKIGTFTATVTVHDDEAASYSAKVSITFDNLPPDITIEGPSEQFEDQQKIFRGTATDRDGSIVSTGWDLGDGTKEDGLTVVHTFTRSGKYKVTFSAVDDRDGRSEKTITVTVKNVVPVPKANWTRVGYVDDLFDFDASSTFDTPSDMDGLEFTWSFGDGQNGEGKNVEHRYTKPGDFEVVLNATDGDGASAELKLLATVLEKAGSGLPGYLTIDIQLIPASVLSGAVVTIQGEVALDLPGGIGGIVWARTVQVTISTSSAGWDLYQKVDLDKYGKFELTVTAPKAGKYTIKASVSISGLSAQDEARLVVRSSSGAVVTQYQAGVIATTATIGVVGVGAAIGGTDLGRWKFFALLIPLYTRLKRDSVLDHFERGRIFEYIGKNPGAHYSEIKTNLDLNNGALAYHLAVLEREQYIKSRSLGLFKRFYPYGFKVDSDRFVPIQDLISAIVRKNPGISQSEMAKLLGVPRSTVNYQCNMLVRSGEIRSDKLGRKKRYWPTEET